MNFQDPMKCPNNSPHCSGHDNDKRELFPPLHANWFRSDKIEMDIEWISVMPFEPMKFEIERTWDYATQRWIEKPVPINIPLLSWRQNLYCRRCNQNSTELADANSFYNHKCEDLR